MSATLTLPTVKAQIVSELGTVLATAGPNGGAVQVTYAWAGSAADPETVFLGRHLSDPENYLTVSLTSPGINPGRRQRDEDYDLPLTVWSFQPGLDPASAQNAEARLCVIVSAIEDYFADNDRAGLAADAVKFIAVTSIDITLLPEDAGWKAQAVLTLNVTARLT